MKKLSFIALLMLASTTSFCQHKSITKPKVVHDTIRVYAGCDALKHRCDSLNTQLFKANYILNNVKLRLAIIKAHPTDKQFLYGWIKLDLHIK